MTQSANPLERLSSLVRTYFGHVGLLETFQSNFLEALGKLNADLASRVAAESATDSFGFRFLGRQYRIELADQSHKSPAALVHFLLMPIDATRDRPKKLGSTYLLSPYTYLPSGSNAPARTLNPNDHEQVFMIALEWLLLAAERDAEQ